MISRVLRTLGLMLCFSVATACFGRSIIIVTATPSPAPTPIQTSTPTAPPTVAATMTPTTDLNAVRLWLSPDVPPEFQTAFDPLVKSGQYAWAKESDAQVKLMANSQSNDLSAQWVYAPVVAFPTFDDDVKWADIEAYWQGNPTALSYLSNTNKPPEFVTSPLILAYMTTLLGAPSPAIQIDQVPPDAIASTIWANRNSAWAIVPFQNLDPQLKVLTLDGASVFNRALDLKGYPLVQNFGLTGDAQMVATTAAAVKSAGEWSSTNRDLSKMTILVMTGVTALSRATAYTMEQKGITLPARDILPFLSDADLVHTSNEVAFATDCPYPNPAYTETTQIRFCSADKYLDLLKTIHLNIVELTGNHVNDWGPDAFAHTLDIYDANHIVYFGGGRNTQDARKGIVVNNNGNRIAFVGCNPVGPAPAWARDDRVGAAKCDTDFLSQEIPRLKNIADVVIMTIQYDEYYQYNPTDDQIKYFHQFADMGANLVMGSQAHQPQGFAFTPNTFIHYGIGNLFFDQMDQLGTRQMFADKIIIYGRKHLSTVLFTGMIEDYSRPRPMTPDERKTLLQSVFQASGW